MFDPSPLFVSPATALRDVIACIDRTAKGVALVVDGDRRLLGVITDGDVRRAVLASVPLDAPAGKLLEAKEDAYETPFTAPVGTPEPQLLQMMNARSLRHIPLLDGEGRVASLALLSDLAKEEDLPLTAVVMAGGFGTRLRPLTETVPKPMLTVGDKPLLELMIDQMRRAGIHRVHVTTHYKSEMISRHFEDGRKFGVEIEYVKEDHPLGTAGALSLVQSSGKPLLVINGDILTRVDFRTMLDFHRDQKAEMTVAVREYNLHIPYGVVETDGAAITDIIEKPEVRRFINAGIYLLSPEAARRVPQGRPCDMPDLIRLLLSEKRRVVSFPVREYWLDIGRHADYDQAQGDVSGGKF